MIDNSYLARAIAPCIRLKEIHNMCVVAGTGQTL